MIKNLLLGRTTDEQFNISNEPLKYIDPHYYRSDTSMIYQPLPKGKWNFIDRRMATIRHDTIKQITIDFDNIKDTPDIHLKLDIYDNIYMDWSVSKFIKIETIITLVRQFLTDKGKLYIRDLKHLDTGGCIPISELKLPKFLSYNKNALDFEKEKWLNKNENSLLLKLNKNGIACETAFGFYPVKHKECATKETYYICYLI